MNEEAWVRLATNLFVLNFGIYLGMDHLGDYWSFLRYSIIFVVSFMLSDFLINRANRGRE